jgi:hypothetical protein
LLELFRWLGIEDAVWTPRVSRRNDRLLDGEVVGNFLPAVLSQDKVKRQLSSDHFSVDGTLLEASASPKSYRVKDASGEPPGPGRNTERDFHGERRKNETHASTTDPDARFFRKGPGKEARLCFLGHALMENRKGLIVGAVTTRASGHARGAGGAGADRATRRCCPRHRLNRAGGWPPPLPRPNGYRASTQAAA